MARWRSSLLKARDRAERRRLRALIDIGELVEAHGFLGRRAELIRRLSGSPAAPSPEPAPGVEAAPGARRPLARPHPRRRPRWGTVLIAVFLPFAWLAAFALRRGRSRQAPMMSVWLGDATGLLACRGRYHRWRGAPVILVPRDWNQNLLVLGGIGSGKTTSVIQPVLWQALGQGVGGLIFDIKGDFGAAVSALCHQRQRPLTVIGPRRTAFNLLRGLTPETAASFLRSALLLAGTPGDPFWIDTAVELCRNALGVLSFMPEHYSLAGLYAYLFEDHARARLDAQLQAEGVGLSPQALRLLRSYQAYHEGVFTRFDAKVVAGVLASAAQVLTPFTHPELIDAFCPAVDTVTVDGLGRGELVLIDLPLSVWGTGAKVIYTFLKLRFFQFMQRRPTADRSRPVLFVCDEYQEIVSANKDGLSDLNFWDKGRAFGAVGLVSAQSIASFYAALNDRDLADTLLQNFRQKLCLRSDDLHTVHFFQKLLGEIEPRGERAVPLVTAQLMRRLHDRQALAVLSIDGEAVEDVIDLPTVLINDRP